MDSYATFSTKEWTDLASSAKALFSLPTIGLPVQVVASATARVATVLAALSSVGFARGIPIYASRQEEIGTNNIGDQILLRANELGTQTVTDNIVPLPRKWRIQGYIQVPYIVRTNNYYLDTNNSILIVQAVKNYLRYLRTMRAPFHFIDREGIVTDVLMEEFTLTDEPESEWATKIDLQLKEYIALSVAKDKYSVLNLPSIGGIFGKSAQYATAGTKVITKALKIYGR